jgi:hypothetical protein
MDMNWFNGSEEELIARFNVGEGGYAIPATALVDETTGKDRDAQLQEEFEAAKQVFMENHGDYQEASQDPKRYFANGRRPDFHSAPAAHSIQTAEERQWVRSYFIDKAVSQAN